MGALYEFLRECATIIGDQPGRLLVLVFYFVIAAILELIGLSLIVPFVTAMVAPNLVRNLPLLSLLSSTVSVSSSSMLAILGIGLIIIFLTKSVAAFLVQRAIFRFSFGEQSRLQQNLFNAYQLLPYEFHLQRNSAELIHSITHLVPEFTNYVVTQGLKLLAESIVAVAILTLLTIRAPVAMLGIAVLLGSIAFMYDCSLRHRFAALGAAANRARTQLIMSINHVIGGYKEVTVLGCQDHYRRLARRSAMECADAWTEYSTLQPLPRHLLESVVVIFIVVFTLFESFRGATGPELLATLGLFGIAAARLLPTMNQIIGSVQSLRFGRTAVRKLYADLQTAKFYQRTSEQKERVISGRIEALESLELRNVSFLYQNSRAPVIRNVSLTLNAGDAIGIIGPSGAGKSTLVDIVLGFLLPQEGEVLFNGRKLEESPRSWLDHVAYLPQTVFLCDDTLRRNVALGISDNEIDDDRVMLALRQARLEMLVAELPKGLNTPVGEQGVRLSGGQRQRVALARAFYHGRDVLILDEATSALDNETECEIVEQIKRLHRLKTMIVIAHRLSTVVNCDRIIKLEHGQITEQGSSEEIIKIEPQRELPTAIVY